MKPRDAGALRAAMQRFVDAPQLVAGMAARSRDLVEKIYDVRKVNHQLLDEMDLLREPWNEPATLHEAPDPLDDLPRSPAGMHDAATSRAIAS